ncbi:ABC transporter permease [uncultured Thiohalocapsa sp.]|uniref:ABC transporter permease n=1 Tax=uncultured Thiohalocapsa sp. TaxID=768990 RepID=UPI0025D60959|nr:ABC transporter permease [uncultured Thiohalocapsa sp.]
MPGLTRASAPVERPHSAGRWGAAAAPLRRLLRALPWLVLLAWLAAALAGAFVSAAANRVDLPRILAPPSAALPLGADDLGRPVLARLVAGARTSLAVGFGVVLLSAVVGTLVGGVAGFAGGWSDLIVVRVIDVFLAFPGILLAIALAGILGPGLGNVVIALAAVGWVGYARLVRAQVLSLRRRDHVLAARALGAGPSRILRRHLLPLAVAPLIVEATFGVAGAVVAEAGLSFLGLGVQPPSASWGSMIRDGVAHMLVAPHLVAAPGLALMLVVLAVNLLGDRLRDHLDVRIARDR